ncbi:MAG: electron transfer flavoprotein subunit alpha/FixB family protein [Bacteroidota bacterium]|nr:electron transfer flavoprotein subunit alpha/FixB family protein [Bacteroidota bacterium]
MSVLAYLEIADQKIKKSSLEIATFASELAKKMNTQAIAIAIGQAPGSEIELAGNYGISKVFHANADVADLSVHAASTAAVFNENGGNVVVLPKSVRVDAFAGRLAVKLKANMVSNVTEVPDTNGGFKVKRSIFTGKAFSIEQLSASNKVLVVKKNAVTINPGSQKAEVSALNAALSNNKVKVTEVMKTSGDILLTEAEIVVSGGRGMKGPENWHLIENLAKELGAATGCSKPVSDMDWRPHHEHVGQTGVKVAPNIYFAVGISGAIQHLAGVNSSKCIVVINKDPEAPFFKAADYGIVGDAFEILPKLTAAVKNYK